MSDESRTGVTRLRRAGFGVVLGGIFLATLVSTFQDLQAAGALLVLGVAGWFYERSREDGVRDIPIGIGSIGAIALLEALPGFGTGIGLQVFSLVAIAFGILDIVLGRLLARFVPGL